MKLIICCAGKTSLRTEAEEAAMAAFPDANVLLARQLGVPIFEPDEFPPNDPRREQMDGQIKVPPHELPVAALSDAYQVGQVNLEGGAQWRRWTEGEEFPPGWIEYHAAAHYYVHAMGAMAVSWGIPQWRRAAIEPDVWKHSNDELCRALVHADAIMPSIYDPSESTDAAGIIDDYERVHATVTEAKRMADRINELRGAVIPGHDNCIEVWPSLSLSYRGEPWRPNSELSVEEVKAAVAAAHAAGADGLELWADVRMGELLAEWRSQLERVAPAIKDYVRGR